MSARLQGARASKARSEAARCDHVLDPSPDGRGGSGGGLIGADSPLALCAALPPDGFRLWASIYSIQGLGDHTLSFYFLGIVLGVWTPRIL